MIESGALSLNRTKLHRPPVTSDHLHRIRLDRLDMNRHQPLRYLNLGFILFEKLKFVSDPVKRMNAIIGIVFVFIGLSACTAHYPHSSSITSIQALKKFSLTEKRYKERAEKLLLLLTFSGGGTRAAAFSYGVLETLAGTEILINGKARRLLDEVDGISSVSGGSFTAAYFGLFGDRIFEDFEDKFLKNDVQTELLKHMLSPLSWPKLGSLYYDRSDLAADYYDELLFEKKTFEGFARADRPFIAINATDAALGSQFTFNASQFAPICTDLLSFPVSRAVTASSAVPGAFTSIILKNHAGTCDYQLPEWAVKSLGRKTTSTRQHHYAETLKAYLDKENYPYIHLFDGGISDNLGIRTIINATLPTGDIWKKLEELHLKDTDTLAIIVVNSRKDKDISFAKKDYSIPLIETLGVASSVPLDHYSFETMEILRGNMKRWRKSIAEGRCKEMKSRAVAEGKNESVASHDCTARTYLIEVSFDALEDKTEKEYLMDLPTSFQLKPEDVDRLTKAAWQILNESDEFQDLIRNLK
jgi:NTE family protein